MASSASKDAVFLLLLPHIAQVIYSSKDYTRGKNPYISMQFYLLKSNEGAKCAEKYTQKGPGKQRLGDLDGMVRRITPF